MASSRRSARAMRAETLPPVHQAGPTAGPLDQRPLVLIIDDDQVIQETLAALLEPENYLLVFATGGAEGLEKAAEFLPDVILLDVIMPFPDGLEVCRRLRADSVLAEVPIVLISTLDDRETRLAGLNAGADDFLPKPFDSQVLLGRLKTITRLNRYRHLRLQHQQLQTLTAELATAYDQTIEGWSRALEARDWEAHGHSQRVTEKTLELARAAGLEGPPLEHIRRGALLHDVGQLGVPDAILLKPQALTAAEWQVMQQHPTWAYEWLSHIESLRPALEIPHCHHEQWGGAGYPRGLQGEEIPLSARLFAIVDAWDVLRAARPYRPRWSDAEALTYLVEQSGRCFDPHLVRIFVQLCEPGPAQL